MSKLNYGPFVQKLDMIQKQLTGREFEGYLKGKIIELRYSLFFDMSYTEIRISYICQISVKRD